MRARLLARPSAMRGARPHPRRDYSELDMTSPFLGRRRIGPGARDRLAARSRCAARARPDPLGRAPRRSAAVQPAARAGSSARSPVGRRVAARARDRGLGRARSGGPHLQRGQELPRAARGRGGRRRAAARRARDRRLAAAGHRLRRQRAQPRGDVGAPAHADERVERHQLRAARHRGPLAQGGAGSAAGSRAEGRRAAAADARHLLGIQRRAHQPARTGPAAPVPRAAARGVPGARAAPARRRTRLCMARLRRRLGRRAGRRAPAVGARRLALGRRRVDQRTRPGAHRPVDAGRRQARGAAAHRRSLAALDGRAVRHRAVLRPAAVAQPRRQGLRRRVARGILHARRRRPHGVGGSCLQRRGRAALARSGAHARRDPPDRRSAEALPPLPRAGQGGEGAAHAARPGKPDANSAAPPSPRPSPQAGRERS